MRSNARDWAVQASSARAQIGTPLYGDHDETLTRVAKAFGIQAQTMRRDIAALAFVEANFPDLQNELLTAPAAAIEHVARWYRYDKVGARVAALALSRGGHTVRSLAAAEANARGDHSAILPGRSLVVDLRRRAVDQLLLTHRELTALPNGGRSEFDAVVDAKLQWEGSSNRSAALVLFGPYKSKLQYKVHVGTEMLKAIGLTHIYSLVIVACEDSSTNNLAVRWLKYNRIESDAIELMTVR